MTNHPNRSKHQEQQAKQWETLANEAIADAGDWKRQCRDLQAINAELLAALKAGRSFLAYAQTYDRARMTAVEVKACDEAMRRTDAIIAKAEGR